MKKVLLSATFNGAPGSLGYENGTEYAVAVTRLKGMLELSSTNPDVQLPKVQYGSFFALMQNWTNIKVLSFGADDGRTELTYGEKAVGLTFNPGGSAEVDGIKRACADTIDYLNDLREKAKGENNGEKIAQFTLAIRAIQDGQMWGVKAQTWQY